MAHEGKFRSGNRRFETLEDAKGYAEKLYQRTGVIVGIERLPAAQFESCALRKAGSVQAGDRVCFEMRSASYVVDVVEQTAIGMVRHQHEAGSNSYWPHELLYVEIG